eukprot:gnl/TRDRNA2_/TRDRNA2_199075_c0_seq1.p1 gnl/TRDRNA2_/TRDRNA2_199075_c0~~gnl/TRDRNA2_/TRDRNA2_199075_c0_seq1.p1  ORF type:complete len:453 (-),score=60.12 gnl/TRDRNA2_/TRDRNA2_199075_c0_seq1:74-1432(-)
MNCTLALAALRCFRVRSAAIKCWSVTSIRCVRRRSELSWAPCSAATTAGTQWSAEWHGGSNGHVQVEQLLSQWAGSKNEYVPSKVLDAVKEAVDAAGGLPTMPHGIGLHPVVHSISRIDPVLQQFTAHGVVVMKWFDPAIAALPAGMEIAAQECNTLPPAPSLSNAVGDVLIQTPGSLTVQFHNGDAPGVVHGVWKWSAVLHSEFVLDDFPFDFQKLPVVFWFASVGVHGPAYGRVFLPYSCSDKGLKTTAQHAKAMAEWELFAPRLRWWSQRVPAGKIQRKPAKQTFVLEVRMLRKGNFYIRMMATMCLIVSLGFTIYALEPLQLSERLSILVTLLVALITFKFTVAGMLPKVCYPTQFDRYMNASIYLITGFAICASGMREALRQDLLKPADAMVIERTVVLPTATTLWLLYHVLLAARFLRHTRKIRATVGPAIFPGHSQPPAFRMGII